MIRLLNRLDDEHIIGFYDGDDNERKKDISDIASAFLSIYGIEGEITPTTDSSILCGYDYNEDKVLLNNDNALRASIAFANMATSIDDKYYEYFMNYYYLYIASYGLMHLAQKKMYSEESTNNAFRYLYDISREYSDNGFVSLDKRILIPTEGKPKILTPMEIEANNRARYRAYLLMRSTKLPMKKSEILRYHFLISLIGYYGVEGIPPIKKAADEYHNIDLYKLSELMKNTRMSIKDRMNLGLEVDPKTFEYVVKRSEKVLRKASY